MYRHTMTIAKSRCWYVAAAIVLSLLMSATIARPSPVRATSSGAGIYRQERALGELEGLVKTNGLRYWGTVSRPLAGTRAAQVLATPGTIRIRSSLALSSSRSDEPVL